MRRHDNDDTLVVINTGEAVEMLRVDGVRPVLNHFALGEPASVSTTGIGAEFRVAARSAAIYSIHDV